MLQRLFEVFKRSGAEESKKLRDLTSFSEIDDSTIDIILKHGGYEGFNSKEEAREELFRLVKFYKTLKNPVELYRIIEVRDKKDINVDDIGLHWVLNPELFHDKNFLDSIGISNRDDYIKYVIKAHVDLRRIDVVETLFNNINHPQEQELTLNRSFGNIRVESFNQFDL